MASPFLHMTPTVNKLNGRDISNTARREYLLKRTKVMQYCQQKDYQAVPTRRNVSMIEVSGQMCSDAFRARLGFRFTIDCIFFGYGEYMIYGFTVIIST